MNWIYTIRYKFLAALIMAVMLGVILWNNLNDSRNMRQLEASFASIYEDRLLVESYIYHLSENLHRESEMVESAVNHHKQAHIKDSLMSLQNNTNQLLSDYEKTRLTVMEEKFFFELKEVVDKINRQHNQLIDDNIACKQLHSHNKIQQDFDKAQILLSHLSDIQIKEGRSINETSKAVIMGSASSSQLENALLIFVALVIQALIFTSKSTSKELGQKYWLN